MAGFMVMMCLFLSLALIMSTTGGRGGVNGQLMFAMVATHASHPMELYPYMISPFTGRTEQLSVSHHICIINHHHHHIFNTTRHMSYASIISNDSFFIDCRHIIIVCANDRGCNFIKKQRCMDARSYVFPGSN